MKTTVALLVSAMALLMGCNSEDSAGPKANESEASSHASPGPTDSGDAPAGGIVGRWERVLTCRELTSELTKAGLGPLASYAWLGQTSSTGQGSFTPGSPKPTKGHPCVGALPRKHSHFFDATGRFGSLDWLGGQVDDGTYVLVDDTTLRIGQVAFHFRVVNDDTLLLRPVLTKVMLREARARPQEFSDAGWAVSVAYAGHPWKRVPCGDWC
jgi:hypothetical protein